LASQAKRPTLLPAALGHPDNAKNAERIWVDLAVGLLLGYVA